MWQHWTPARAKKGLTLKADDIDRRAPAQRRRGRIEPGRGDAPRQRG